MSLGAEESRRHAQGSALSTEADARAREVIVVQADGVEILRKATQFAPQRNCHLRRSPAGVVKGVHEASFPRHEVERESAVVGAVSETVESEQVAEQCQKFWQFVRDKRRKRGIETRWIINADQTPLWLEMSATTTVDQTGVRSVPIRSAGYQKERVTVMLACTADGEKLKLWVFFKRKMVPKGDFPPSKNVVVAANPNGWMDTNGVMRWLDECIKPFTRPRFDRQARSTMVVLDSYRRHLTDAVKENFADLDIMPAVIPSGCTAEVQPLNVSINKSFKASIHQHYQSWFEEEGQERLTPAGNIKKPSPAVVLRWISRAWKAVPPELIKKAFLTCGISNALDGFEDGLAMAHWQSQLTHEVDVDDEIFASGFFGNNCEEPESDDE
ncbi:unnamed protein product [Closterium sp. NIES-54]